jgi:hypothetical protein
MFIDTKIISRFDQAFRDESSCRNRLASLRWGPNLKNFKCPRCFRNGTLKSSTDTGLFRCTKCHRRISVRQGTIFQDGKLSLREWFRAIWIISYHEWGVNASDLKKILGLKNYPVAFKMLRKVRHAMKSNNSSPLVSNKFELGTVCLKTVKEDSLILMIVEKKLIKPGLIRLEKLEKPGRRVKITLEDIEEIAAKLSRHIEDGTSLWVDGTISKQFLPTHYIVSELEPREKAKKSCVTLVDIVAEKLREWLTKNYRGHVNAKGVQLYLDEFVFWWNLKIESEGDRSRSTPDNRENVFERLLELGLSVQ